MELDRYKTIIDEDFKTFLPINKRFFQLEKSWILNISHRIMPCHNSGGTFFTHEDRKELRNILLKYLNSKKLKGGK